MYYIFKWVQMYVVIRIGAVSLTPRTKDPEDNDLTKVDRRFRGLIVIAWR